MLRPFARGLGTLLPFAVKRVVSYRTAVLRDFSDCILHLSYKFGQRHLVTKNYTANQKWRQF